MLLVFRIFQSTIVSTSIQIGIYQHRQVCANAVRLVDGKRLEASETQGCQKRTERQRVAKPVEQSGQEDLRRPVRVPSRRFTGRSASSACVIRLPKPTGKKKVNRKPG